MVDHAVIRKLTVLRIRGLKKLEWRPSEGQPAKNLGCCSHIKDALSIPLYTACAPLARLAPTATQGAFMPAGDSRYG